MAHRPERVELERTGGFANVPVRASLATDALDPHERAGVDAVLGRVSAAGPQPGAPDRHQYDLTVVTGGRRHHVRLGENEIDDRLRPLINRLERDAEP